jgi:hypothetical protein
LESLSREDLVNLVRILLVDEAHKQLETTKKEAEESAKQAEVQFKFFFEFFLGFLSNFNVNFPDSPIGAGEGETSCRFAPKSGRNRGNAQGVGGEV